MGSGDRQDNIVPRVIVGQKEFDVFQPGIEDQFDCSGGLFKIKRLFRIRRPTKWALVIMVGQGIAQKHFHGFRCFPQRQLPAAMTALLSLQKLISAKLASSLPEKPNPHNPQ